MMKKPVRKPTPKAIMRKGEKISFSYKDVATLSRFVGESGTLLSRERTGLSNKKQRELSVAVKRARYVALLPFVTTL